jgi:hypothetical protein
VVVERDPKLYNIGLVGAGVGRGGDSVCVSGLIPLLFQAVRTLIKITIKPLFKKSCDSNVCKPKFSPLSLILPRTCRFFFITIIVESAWSSGLDLGWWPEGSALDPL